MKAGWQTNKLGDVCSFLNRGISPKYLEAGGICVLNQKCIRNHEVNFDLARRHDTSAKSVSAERLVQFGDVLINSTGTGTLGRVAQLRQTPDEPTTVDSHVTIARPLQGKFFSDFFGYMLVFIEEAIKEAGEGCGGQTELARSALAERFSVTYPSDQLAQQRIVAILDAVFADIATAKANAEKNLQNARALFDSYLKSIFMEQGDEWQPKQLGQVAEVQSGGTPTVSIKEFWNGDIPWYSSGELKKTLTTNPERHITSDGLNSSNAKLFPKGSLLVGMYDTAALKMSILDRDGAFNQAIAGVKPNENIDVEFILHAINSEKTRLLLERRGVRQKNLSLGKIKEIVIPLPALEKQREVVAKLCLFRSETQRLEAIHHQKLTTLHALKKSLLHQAFSGSL